MPNTGDKVNHENFVFEVVDMDGVRIDKILMTKIDT
jgi:CBS domain containing-hemolysin-like protein